MSVLCQSVIAVTFRCKSRDSPAVVHCHTRDILHCQSVVVLVTVRCQYVIVIVTVRCQSVVVLATVRCQSVVVLVTVRYRSVVIPVTFSVARGVVLFYLLNGKLPYGNEPAEKSDEIKLQTFSVPVRKSLSPGT